VALKVELLWFLRLIQFEVDRIHLLPIDKGREGAVAEGQLAVLQCLGRRLLAVERCGDDHPPPLQFGGVRVSYHKDGRAERQQEDHGISVSAGSTGETIRKRPYLISQAMVAT